MSPQAFIANNNGQQVDLDGFPSWQPYQCYDLANKWSILRGYSRFGGLYASDIYGQQPGNYTWIPNSPSAVPQAGDVVVWNRNYGNGAGHVAVANGVGNTSYFESFDQNWNVPRSVIVRHSYDGVIGWGRPKNISNAGIPAVGSNDVITDQDRDHLRVVNSEIKGWDFNAVHTGQYDQREMNAWKGQPWTKFLGEAWNEGEAFRNMRNQKLADYDRLSKQVSEMSARPTKDQLAEVVKQVSESNAKVTELEKKLAENTGGNPDDIVVSRRWWSGLFDKIKTFIGGK